MELKACQGEYLCMLHAGGEGVLYVGRASQTLSKTQPPRQTKIVSNHSSMEPIPFRLKLNHSQKNCQQP